MTEEIAFKIDLAWPDTIKWNKMSEKEKNALTTVERIMGKPPKPVKWGKFLNRWVTSFSCQAILPCGRIYRCGLRTGKTFDYFVPEDK